MKYFKFKVIIILFIILIFYYHFKNIKIVELWKLYHVNSLIGLQKFIEGIQFSNNNDINLWYKIILPFLELPIILLIISIFLLTIITIKK
jgi:hypothetical protein